MKIRLVFVVLLVVLGLLLIHGERRRPIVIEHADPAPLGVNVADYRSTADLVGSVNGSPDHTGTVQCIGDGTSGPRVQAVYAVASDQVDRYADIAPLIQTWAGYIDGVFAQSAAESGGVKHVRFVTNPDCTLNVAHVVLSPTGDDNIDNTENEMAALGYNRSLTKYLIWMDANVYCGIADIVLDDSPGQSNFNNWLTDYGRVDNGCWGRTDHLSEAHELMHTLGGVQASAPHASAHYHCTDENDAMCYPDAIGVTMTYPCPSGHEWLFDCNDDDYFDTNPSAGSYLATHWNVANSQFLDPPAVIETTTTTATTLAPTTTTLATTTTTVAPTTTTIESTTTTTIVKCRSKGKRCR